MKSRHLGTGLLVAMTSLVPMAAAGPSVSPAPAAAPAGPPGLAGPSQTSGAPGATPPEVRQYISALEENLSLHACRAELRYLLAIIQENCAAARDAGSEPLQVVADQPPDPGLPGTGPKGQVYRGPFRLQLCSESLVKDSLVSPHRILPQRLPDLLREVPHVALYPSAEVKEPPKGRRFLLQSLLSVPPLHTTRWLIVTAPDDNRAGKARSDDALWRLRWATDLLLSKKVSPASISAAWLYDLGLEGVGLDRPNQAELSTVGRPKAVFLFRLNC